MASSRPKIKAASIWVSERHRERALASGLRVHVTFPARSNIAIPDGGTARPVQRLTVRDVSASLRPVRQSRLPFLKSPP
jgi:hypothetical protein